MVFHGKINVEVAGRAAVRAETAFAAQANGIARLHAGRDPHRERSLALDPSPAMARGTGIGDHPALTAAAAAGTGNAEKSLLHVHLTRAAAIGTGGDALLGFRAGPVTIGTTLEAGHPDLGRGAEGGFFEGYLEIEPEIISGGRSCPAAASAKKFLEDISEDVPHARACPEPGGTLRARRGAVLVIVCPLLRIGQDLVGLVDLFELFFGRFISGIFVRMVLVREPAIGALQLRVSGVPVNAEKSVVIFCHVPFHKNPAAEPDRAKSLDSQGMQIVALSS